MKALIACEESQAVTIEFRKLGHEAYSCDIIDCSGDHPEWHLKQDVIPLLEEDWDIIIAFPPCSHLAISGARWFEQKKKDGRQQSGIDFFMRLTDVKCPKVAIENPVGIMSNIYRKPDQIVTPRFWGDPYEKKTCLWLKGLPKLVPTNIVEVEQEDVTFESGVTMSKWYRESFNLPGKERAKFRSKTFSGLARAMAEQWSI